MIGFKKIKFFTNENVGDGKLELPENEMHTTAFWLTLERPLVESLPFSVSDRQSGMFGLLHALESIATLLLMCDARDLGTAIGERPPSPGSEIEWEEAPSPEAIAALAEKEFFEPNLYLYDAYPGGIGFSEPLYRAHDYPAGKNARADRRVPLRKRLPVVRRPRRRARRARQRSGAGNPLPPRRIEPAQSEMEPQINTDEHG